MKKFKFREQEVTIEIKEYQNNHRKAILLKDSEGMPYTTATMNVDVNDVPKDFVVIKDYSENQGVYKFLVNNNVIMPVNRSYPLAFSEAPICLLNDESLWEPWEEDPDANKRDMEDGWNID